MANITEQLKETRGKIRESKSGGTKREITMISEGWGSSGYYSGKVLERDIPRVFPIGTKMYLDHPSMTENRERPERSLRDLVGVTTSIPRMAGIDMITECEVYDHWAPVINELADDIGVSIRGDGVVEAGSAGGKDGPIVQAITEGFSVDFVTSAGAGGRVGPLIESARGFVDGNTEEEVSLAEAANMLDHMASRIHSNFTSMADHAFGQGVMTRDERKTSSAAIGKALDAFNDHIEQHAPQMQQRSPMMESGHAAVAPEIEHLSESYLQLLERDVPNGERILLAKKGQAIPIKNDKGEIIGGRFPMANCGDVSNAAESVGRTNQPDIKAFITKVAGKLSCPMPFKESGSSRTTEEAELADDKRLSELEESVRSLEKFKEDAETKLSESEQREKDHKDRADRAEEALRLREAGAICSDVVEGVEGLPKTAKTRVIESALRKELPLDSDGKLDKDVLKERAEKALKDEIEYVGTVSGRGTVRGIGESARPAGGGEGDKKELSALEESFVDMGMSKESAKIAAEGR